jgi:hypothetical protein
MRDRPASALGRARAVHPHAWLWEPLETDPTFVLRAMFGAKAVYLGGQMMLCCCADEEPWRGLLVCTDRTRHAALQSDFPALTPHSVLPKWLYLPESAATFERDAVRLVALARGRDPRLGIIPGARKKKPAAPAISLARSAARRDPATTSTSARLRRPRGSRP